MDGTLWERICGWFTGPQALWTAVWIGLGALTVFLVVLTYTRWGLSHSIEKCMVLSLLAHVLLAVAATTVQVQLASSGSPLTGPGDPLAVAITDDPGEAVGDSRERGDPRGQSPSEHAEESIAPIASPDSPDRMESDAPDMARTVDEVPSTPAIDEPPLIEAPREIGHEGHPAPSSTARAAAEPIETVAAEQRVAPTMTDPANGSPGRPEGTSTEANALQRSDTSSVAATPAVLPDVPDAARPDAVSGITDDEPRTGTVKAAPAAAAEHTSGASALGGNSSGASGGTGTIVRPGGGKLPAVYGGRFAPDRLKAAGSRGATADTEAAVAAALEYLVRHQSADGHWDPVRLEGGREDATHGHDRQGAGIGADSGITGLAILAFLGAGHTHLEGKHQDSVRRGLEYLLSVQKGDGNLAGGARFFAEMYCHAMATCALSEAYAVTGDRRLESAVQRAIEFIMQAQNPTTGGWRYQTWRKAPDDPGDMSQHGWQILSLKSAELAGIRVPDLVKTRAMRFVTSSSSGEHGGKAAYRPREQATTVMTAEAWVCREFLGMTRTDAQASEAAQFVATELPGGKRTNFYYLYYGTLATYQIGGDYWTAWNDALRPTLVRSQRTEGALAGSWDPDAIWGGYGGRVFSTALGAMCLEVYYRYLPLYGQE
jgi:hypothetical protein